MAYLFILCMRSSPTLTTVSTPGTWALQMLLRTSRVILGESTCTKSLWGSWKCVREAWSQSRRQYCWLGEKNHKLIYMSGCALILHVFSIEHIPMSGTNLIGVAITRLLKWDAITEHKSFSTLQGCFMRRPSKWFWTDPDKKQIPRHGWFGGGKGGNAQEGSE